MTDPRKLILSIGVRRALETIASLLSEGDEPWAAVLEALRAYESRHLTEV